MGGGGPAQGASAAGFPEELAAAGDNVFPAPMRSAEEEEEEEEEEESRQWEFGGEVSDDSSSWSASEEETDAPIDRNALPAWLAKRGGGEESSDEEEAKRSGPGPAESQVFAAEVLEVGAEESISLAGTVCSVVGPLVVVQAPAGQMPLDDGSVLCLADRTVLGVVEETFGPVQAPLYAVRRCKPVEGALVSEMSGNEVFFVSGRSTFITDVERLRVKGYDASGKEDEEVEAEEFSDDEKEAEARLATKLSHKRAVDGDSAPAFGRAAGSRGGRGALGGARVDHPPKQHASPADMTGYPPASGLAQQQQLLQQQQWAMYMQWQAMQMQMQGGGGWPFPSTGGPFPWPQGQAPPPP